MIESEAVGNIAASQPLQIAVLVPCYNEGKTVRSVIEGFRSSLPQATIYVYDNNSDDDTVDIAAEAGAVVRREQQQGKGNVVRRMFADIEADVYILVDGDDTYDAKSAPRLIEELLSGPYDIVNGARTPVSMGAYRRGHVIGNRLLTGLVQIIFGTATADMLSGYKAMSRRYVKSFPAESRGFEIETELVVHSLQMRLPKSELNTPYRERPDGSESKLRTFRDGARILRLIAFLVKEEKPLLFFAVCAALFALVSVALGVSIVLEFYETGLVARLPTAILALGLMILAFLSLASGLVLDTIARGRRESKRLAYLRLPAAVSKEIVP